MAIHIRVRRSRPRVYLSDELLPDIKRRTETTHVEEWSQLVVWARGIAKTPESYKLRPERLGERARRLAFMYSIRGDMKDLEFALSIVPHLIDAPPNPDRIEALAHVYDALESAFPEKLAARTREALITRARALFDRNVKGAPVLAPRRSVTVVSAFAAGLALYGEVDEAQQLIAEAVHAARDLTGTLMYFLEEDGGFPLGWAESCIHAGQLPRLALLAQSGLGQSWPTEAPWLERYAEFLEEGMRDGPLDPRHGPTWADGMRGDRRLELWRILTVIAEGSGNQAAKRLLSTLPLRGCQDEKILYERRESGHGTAADESSSAPLHPRAKFYRRAGIALLRSDPGQDAELEVVVRSPVASLDGAGQSGAGGFSIAHNGDLVSLTHDSSDTFAIACGDDDDQRPPRTFPRTRREVNLDEHMRSEVLAYDSIPDAGEWLLLDLSAEYTGDAESVTRHIAFMRGVSGWPVPVLVVYDEIRLKTPGGDVASMLLFRSRPEVSETIVRAIAGSASILDCILLPDAHQVWVDELMGTGEQPSGGLWRVRLGSTESGATTRMCQVFFSSPGDLSAEARCAVLRADGATVLDVAGRGLVIAGEDCSVVEAAADGDLDGVMVIGISPNAKVKSQVAGKEPQFIDASEWGGLFIPGSIPSGTGFRMQIDTAPGGGKRASMRIRAADPARAD